MAVDERDRLRLFEDAKGVLPERSAVTLMEMLSGRDELRVEMAEFRTEMRTAMADLRTEMAEFRTEMRTEMGDLCTEMAEFRTEMRTEMAELRVDIAGKLRAQTIWMCSSMMTALVAGMGLAAGVTQLG